MKMRWKKIVAILGAVTIVASSGNLMTVRAAEQPTENAVDEVSDENEKEGTLDSTDEKETSSSTEAEKTSNSGEEQGDSNSVDKEETSGSPEETSTEDSADKTSEEDTKDENASEEETEGESETELEEDGIMLLSEDADGENGELKDADSEDGELKVAEELRWSDEIPGQAVFYNPNDENISYELHLYKDGNSLGGWSGPIDGIGDVEVNTVSNIMESGVYTYRVELFAYGVKPDYDLSDGCVSEVSSDFVYTRPDSVISIPQNIKCGTDGKVTWDAVENAYGYWSCLYYKDDNQNYVMVMSRGRTDAYTDWSDKLGEGYDYYVNVRTVSNNINKYANSEWSDYIPFDTSAVGEKVSEKLNETISGVTSDNVSDQVQAVKNGFKDNKGELRTAMQTDPSTQGIIADLEEKYIGEKHLTVNPEVSEDIGIGASEVKVLGAALNATEEGGSITFNMSKPDEETQKDLITNSHFKNAIALNFDLYGAGIKEGDELAIPVTITMPIPEGIEDVNSLAIIHYKSDNTIDEYIEPHVNGDGTISFTVTHFSNFVFGEDKRSSGSNSSNSGSSSSSGDDDSESVSVVDNSWKPTTPDEIKRYSFYSREKVNYTMDVTNAYPVTITNAMQGKLCFDSFEAVLGDYTIGRTYNIFPSTNGKAVYKMPTAAKITLTIPNGLQKANREYKMICVTEKGLPIVLDDIDTNPNTITFSTDSYYAFALIYKDAAPSNLN